MKQSSALEHQLTALMTKAEKTFRHDGAVVLPRVIVRAFDDAWVALCRDRDHARVERLVAVISLLIARESTKFKSDRKRWLERQTLAQTASTRLPEPFDPGSVA